MIIRRAKPSDSEELIELMQKSDNRSREWAEQKTISYSASRKKFILVAEIDGKLVGFAGIKKYEDNKAREFTNLNDSAWITWIAVLPEFRKMKIGSALLRDAEKSAKGFNKHGLILDCMEKVLDFYKINGYNIAGVYESKNASRFVMEKKL